MAQFPAHSLALLLGEKPEHYLSIRTLLYFLLFHKRKINTSHREKVYEKTENMKQQELSITLETVGQVKLYTGISFPEANSYYFREM